MNVQLLATWSLQLLANHHQVVSKEQNYLILNLFVKHFVTKQPHTMMFLIGHLMLKVKFQISDSHPRDCRIQIADNSKL